MQHLRQCKVVTLPSSETQSTNVNITNVNPNEPSNEIPEQFYWGEMKGSIINDVIAECYEKIVFWKKNLFMLPNGSSGKNFIREITRLLNSFSENTPLRPICMKAIHIMPALLLQKPSKSSKAKEHANILERRLLMWHKGDISALFEEASTIQSRLNSPTGKRDIGAISKRFKEHM